MPEWSKEFERTITTISSDYETGRPPFDEEHFPEARAVRGIEGEEERARFLTFTASLDYHRPSDRHYEPMAELRERSPWMFDPSAIAAEPKDEFREELQTVFLRYPTKDSEIWHTIATTLVADYNGRVTDLITSSGDDAIALLNRVRRSDGFPYLGGEKIGPMWTRFIHEFVRSLSRVGALDIPVDVQVRRVTRYLAERTDSNIEASDDGLRDFWRTFCDETGQDPVHVDKPLWILGANWNEWGSDYVDARLG